MRASVHSLVLASLLLGTAVYADDILIEATSKDNSDQCDCYLSSGPDPGYFQYHRFWDYRNISNDGSNDYTAAPELLTDGFDGSEAPTSSYFNSSSFIADWSIASGKQNRNSPISAIDTPQNIYISRNSTDGAESPTFLTLRTQRLTDAVATCEMDSNQKNVLHSSIRGRFRVIPNYLNDESAPFSGERMLSDDTIGSNASHPVANGAVFGLFTYKSDTQESDIEVLTSDPINNIRYSNQPDYDAKTDQSVPGASTQAVMPTGTDWTQWQDHRIDWFDGISRWYVNDQLVLEKKLNVPSQPSQLILNLWSDGGNWSGNMSLGSQVTVAVQWVEMAFNISGKVSGKRDHLSKRANHCHIGCNLDSIAQVGFPEVAFDNASSAGSTLKLTSRSTLQVYGLVMVLSLLGSWF